MRSGYALRLNLDGALERAEELTKNNLQDSNLKMKHTKTIPRPMWRFSKRENPNGPEKKACCFILEIKTNF